MATARIDHSRANCTQRILRRISRVPAMMRKIPPAIRETPSAARAYSPGEQASGISPNFIMACITSGKKDKGGSIPLEK